MRNLKVFKLLLIIIFLNIFIVSFIFVNYNYKEGYLDGQENMAIRITDKLNNNIKLQDSVYNKRYLFRSFDENNFYIYSKDGIKTIIREKNN